MRLSDNVLTLHTQAELPSHYVLNGVWGITPAYFNTQSLTEKCGRGRTFKSTKPGVLTWCLPRFCYCRESFSFFCRCFPRARTPSLARFGKSCFFQSMARKRSPDVVLRHLAHVRFWCCERLIEDCNFLGPTLLPTVTCLQRYTLLK